MNVMDAPKNRQATYCVHETRLRSIELRVPGLFFPRFGGLLEANHDSLLRIADALDFDDAGRLDQFAQAGEAIVPGIELRRLLRDVRADPGEIGPPFFVRYRRDGGTQGGEELRIAGHAGWLRPRLLASRRSGSFGTGREHVEIDELVAGGDEGGGGLAPRKTLEGDAPRGDGGGKGGQ